MQVESTSEPDQGKPDEEFAEVDPSGRYGRYPEVLGKGAFKTVYKAFDELEGIEVAWNQVKLADVLRNSNDLERLRSEVHLLKTLKHKNIIKFYNSWVDTKCGNINFITEVFTSGTLRQYRKKHKHVDTRALKNWSRQILSGLNYLHGHDPPVIHRDLKCDNIFVNGNQGEVKIGDLGLAAILCHAQSAHSVIGTPEFMAPELYEEEYNELVDIYAFGMCLLELVTLEYPYVECTNAAQIYKRVTSGIKPASLAKVKDPTVKQFIEKCITNASDRLPARELLMDPFLQLDMDNESIGCSLQPALYDADNGGRSHASAGHACDGVESAMTGRDFTVEGQRKDINTIHLKLRIVDSTGQVRNIHFPFDIQVDTSISVATEMVAELDLTDQDVTTIAAMIDAEIQVHVPEWFPGEALHDNHGSELVEAEDELPTLPNESDNSSGRVVLERLRSGQMYWFDSPKGTNTDSPSDYTNSHLFCDLSSHVGNDIPVDVSKGIESNSDHKQTDSCSHGIHSPDKQKDLPPTNKRGEDHGFIASLGLIDISNLSSNDVIKNRHGEVLTCICQSQTGEVADQQEGGNESLYKQLLENEPDDVKFIMLKLENLLVNQQKEYDELKKKHDKAIADVLKELPPELRSRILKMCCYKVSNHKVYK